MKRSQHGAAQAARGKTTAWKAFAFLAPAAAILLATACAAPARINPRTATPAPAVTTPAPTATVAGAATAPLTATVPVLVLDQATPVAPQATPPPPAAGRTPPPGDPSPGVVRLQPVATGLRKPLALIHVPGDRARQAVLEQDGLAVLIKNGTVAAQPFADLRNLVSTGRERGLLGLAFAPNLAANGRVFVHYTGLRGETVVARYRVDAANPDRLDPGSARIILTIEQPSPNHNGGPLLFGPDGYLYLGLGEGTAGGDPMNNGQNLDVLLGKVLRLDVSQEDGYRIPADNPFVGRPGRDEVWAYGLRNPWRLSFDRETGDLWIADVGESRTEEVNLQPAGSRGGENYGWRVFEGSRVNDANQSAANHVPPAHEYTRQDEGCAVIGGYVFGDYCSGMIWGLRRAGNAWERRELMDTDFTISNFGQDADGELHVVDYAGGLHKLVP